MRARLLQMEPDMEQLESTFVILVTLYRVVPGELVVWGHGVDQLHLVTVSRMQLLIFEQIVLVNCYLYSLNFLHNSYSQT